jgi:hypothetical protein
VRKVENGDIKGKKCERWRRNSIFRETLAVGSKMMTLTVRYMRKNTYNDRCEVKEPSEML